MPLYDVAVYVNVTAEDEDEAWSVVRAAFPDAETVPHAPHVTVSYTSPDDIVRVTD